MLGGVRRVHFVGVGGIGMCGLAEWLHAEGLKVTGSDLREGANVDHLRTKGIDVSVGHAASQLGDAELCVVSSAIRQDNPEVEAARQAGIPIIRRGALLGEWMRTRDGIAIAGSHGKTTTTALTTHLLVEAGLDPSALVGGRIPLPDGTRSTFRPGASDLLVAEVDESDGSFLLAHPVFAVVTNIDPEHLDHHGSYEALKESFVRFASGRPFWGAAILGVDHPAVATLAPRIEGRVRSYAIEGGPADLQARAIEADGLGMRFEVVHEGESLGQARIPMPGRHNVANALAALSVAFELSVSFETAVAALATFAGVGRRFERKGEIRGIRIVDDYAHHPAELRATLAAARRAHDGRVIAVFQPHRFTRTRDLFDEFAAAFGDADLVRITDIYAAGEAPIDGVSGEALAGAITAAGHGDAGHIECLDAVVAALPERLRPGDLVLTLGAGDVSSLGPRLLAALEAEGPP